MEPINDQEQSEEGGVYSQRWLGIGLELLIYVIDLRIIDLC